MNIKNKFNYTNQNKKEVEEIVKEILKEREILKNKVKNPKNFERLAKDFKKWYQSNYKEIQEKYDKAVKSGKTADIKKYSSELEDFKNKNIVNAFAICSEAIRREMIPKGEIIPYEVQLQAAVAMTRDNIICDMKTGEGKTLVQIFTSYINALSGEGVHVITANDALAERDCGDNKAVFELLGLTCGFVPSNDYVMSTDKFEEFKKDSNKYKEAKADLYTSDIVYSTASNIVFDYLESNSAYTPEDKIIKRPLNYAIIDEADVVLLDEVTTPLISTKPKKDVENEKKEIELPIPTYEDYLNDKKFLEIVEKMVNNNMENGKIITSIMPKKISAENISEKSGIIYFENTNDIHIGRSAENILLKRYLGLTTIDDKTIMEDVRYRPLIEAFNAYVTALLCLKRNRDYTLEYFKDKNGKIIQDKEGKPKVKKVVLTGQNTGRQTTKRLMNGLHQALEAKEGAEIKSSAVPVGKITFPSFFGKYKKGISGMTGTSDQEEFSELYGLETYEVPTRVTNIRKDSEDELYKTMEEKHKAIIKDVIAHHKKGQPILIGTSSVEESNIISELLKERGIQHNLLNADKNENEEQKIKEAGKVGQVTVSTNMAGRGTDIKLSQEALARGGLYVIGTTYNNSLRTDNQLRGRASRQGQVGETKFYVSLEDDIVIRNDPRLHSDYEKIYGKKTGQITNKIIKKRVKQCQKFKESNDYARRRYQKDIGTITTKVMEPLYKNRDKILESDNISTVLNTVIDSYVEKLSKKSPGEIETLVRAMVTENLASKLDFNDPKKLCDGLKYAVSLMNENIRGYSETVKKNMLRTIDSYVSVLISEYEEIEKSSPLSAVFKSNDLIKEFESQILELTMEYDEYIQNELIAYALSGKAYGKYHIPEYHESKDIEKEKGIYI